MPDLDEVKVDQGFTLCKICKNSWGRTNGVDMCKASEAPVTDFVNGVKECFKINLMGNCKYYIKGVN